MSHSADLTVDRLKHSTFVSILGHSVQVEYIITEEPHQIYWRLVKPVNKNDQSNLVQLLHTLLRMHHVAYIKDIVEEANALRIHERNVMLASRPDEFEEDVPF